MSEYTPNTEEVEHNYAWDGYMDAPLKSREAAFKRWYAAEIRRAKAEALREAGEAIQLYVVTERPDDPQHVDDCATAAAQGWLTGRANKIERTT